MSQFQTTIIGSVMLYLQTTFGKEYFHGVFMNKYAEFLTVLSQQLIKEGKQLVILLSNITFLRF